MERRGARGGGVSFDLEPSSLLLSITLPCSFFFFSPQPRSALLLTGRAHEGKVQRVEEEHDVLALF